MKIPERTVDSMVAIEVTRLDPASIVVSPVNSLAEIDHMIDVRSDVTYFECKGVDDHDKIQIELSQLWEYVYSGREYETIYLLPSRPTGVPPWKRDCIQSDCHNLGGCRYCPRDSRSWNGLEPWIQGLPAERQLQSWFAHWSYCVPAQSLANIVWTRGLPAKPLKKKYHRLDWDDATLGNLPGAGRLCHFFGAIPGSGIPSKATVSARTRPFDRRARPLRRDSKGGAPSLAVLRARTTLDL